MRQGRMFSAPPSFSKHAQKLTVVVEHFFEVRDMPALVHAVPGKASSDMVVDASARHRAQGQQGVGARRLVPLG